MGYRLIAVDIDGTLLDSKNNITGVTKDAIKRAVKSGIIFTISTGRPIQAVEYINRELSLDVPFITYNGAMVVMGRSGKILYEQGMNTGDAEKIYNLGIKYDTSVMLWAENRLYVNRLDDRAQKYGEQANTKPVLIKGIHEILKYGVTKILWYDEVETINIFNQEAGKYLSENINYHTSKPFYLEFVDKKASKGIALKKIGEHYHISHEAMIAVGDGFNDISMIKYAGLGVAMGNAPDAVKQQADYITLSNDEDGLAHVINKFVL
jgi:Cof subfamily protein (haloacid dehalogenase superfamily)